MKNTSAIRAVAGFIITITCMMASGAQTVVPGPLIDPGKLVKISDRVYVIPDESRRYIANTGIVVGQKATLVIDPGLGLLNGTIVLAEALKVSEGRPLYVAATHHHPEHDLGAMAFPSTIPMIRSRTQQREVDEVGLTQAEIFAKREPQLAALIAGSRDRPADVLFDDQYTLDLGGVTVRMYAAGPAHTMGDTIFYVEQDSVLFAGDVAQQRVPLLRVPAPSVDSWLAQLPKLKRLDVKILVPSHGPMGDASIIDVTERYLKTVQSRTHELKAQGMTAEQVAALLTKELPSQFPDFKNFSVEAVSEAVRAVFAEVR